MQDTTSIQGFDEILATDDYSVESRLWLDGIYYGEDKLKSMSVMQSLFNDTSLVGNCVSAEIDVVLKNPNEYIQKMAEMRPYIRLAHTSIPHNMVVNGKLYLNGGSVSGTTLTPPEGSYVTGTTLVINNTPTVQQSGWLQKGVFFIDTRKYSINETGETIMIIHGYDAMLRAGAGYPEDDAEYPQTDIYVVNKIAQAMGIEVDPRTPEIMTSGYMINLPMSYTMREVLGNIAAMYAGNFVISPEGKLRLIGLTDIGIETSYLVDNLGNAIVFGEDRIIV